jgi:hypothetical protein
VKGLCQCVVQFQHFLIVENDVVGQLTLCIQIVNGSSGIRLFLLCFRSFARTIFLIFLFFIVVSVFFVILFVTLDGLFLFIIIIIIVIIIIASVFRFISFVINVIYFALFIIITI